MDKIVVGILVGVGVIGGLVYNNFDRIKMEIEKSRINIEVKELTKDFFKNCLIENPNISLDEAILKFEDGNNKYKNLKEFANSKQRTVENYRTAYGKLFDKAKKELR